MVVRGFCLFYVKHAKLGSIELPASQMTPTFRFCSGVLVGRVKARLIRDEAHL